MISKPRLAAIGGGRDRPVDHALQEVQPGHRAQRRERRHRIAPGHLAAALLTPGHILGSYRIFRLGRFHVWHTSPVPSATDPAVRLVAFDLDDTLAPSKSAIDPRMAELLVAPAGGRRGLRHLRRQLRAVPDPADRRPAGRPSRGTAAHARHADLRDAVLPVPGGRLATAVRREPHRGAEVRRARRPGDRSPAAGTVGDRDLGSHPGRPRIADHVLRTRAGGARRRQEGVGSDRGEEELPARGRPAAAARPRGAVGRVDQRRHHPARHRQGIRDAEAGRADRHPLRADDLRRRPPRPRRQRLPRHRARHPDASPSGSGTTPPATSRNSWRSANRSRAGSPVRRHERGPGRAGSSRRADRRPRRPRPIH